MMIIKLVVIRVLVVVKMCDIGNSDGFYILPTLKLMIVVIG